MYTISLSKQSAELGQEFRNLCLSTPAEENNPLSHIMDNNSSGTIKKLPTLSHILLPRTFRYLINLYPNLTFGLFALDDTFSETKITESFIHMTPSLAPVQMASARRSIGNFGILPSPRA